ncbi:hypothetical protein MFLAVUS_010981 [Mucor flavus]|uniref:Uncharacterized protein n=1 Tax=Mucor flavus TaxID=439312 RepID=A0ABP9ZE89_9FUNG
MEPNITFYSEDGRRNIFDDNGNEAAAYDEVPSFRVKKLVKNNNYLELHEIEVPDVCTEEASIRKKKEIMIFEKGMKNKEAAVVANVKSEVKHHSFKNTETLTSRIVESCEEVPLQHFQNCIQHSVKQFDKCLNKEPI